MDTFLKFVLLLAGGYLLGSIPMAYIATRLKTGRDLRELGSGNVGSANVAASASKWLAVPVIVFDIGKGMFAVYLTRLWGLHQAGFQMAVGLAAICGHNWPVFLRFKGGRGIATSLGVITITSPWLGLIVLVITYIWAPLKQVALGVFLALLSLPLLSWFLAGPLNISSEARLPVTLGFIGITVIAFGRRLLLYRSPISRDVPLGELILNRLFFDRDIRDREAWVKRNLASAQPE